MFLGSQVVHELGILSKISASVKSSDARGELSEKY